jgi:HAD superfamily hydrolase (TIGR01509 family)
MRTMISSLSQVEAVLFDLDGTLVDTNIDFPLMKRELCALASKEGLPAAELARLDILAMVDEGAMQLQFLGKLEQAKRFRSSALAKLEEIELRHAATASEVPGARELVARLKAKGIKVGIVTRNCRSASELALRLVGIEPDVLVCREDCSACKPHPDQLHVALTKLGANPSYSVMIGDHIVDVQSGNAAGLMTIGLLRDNKPCNFFDNAKPDLVVRSLTEVMRAIIGDNC